MKQSLFNDGWTISPGVQQAFATLGGEDKGVPVVLPHDAMIAEPRDPQSPSGGQMGFYPAKCYTYRKTFTAPESWEGSSLWLEFEGIQQRAMVYLNGEFLGSHANGYTGFLVDLVPSLRLGKENELKVLALGREEASRWYSGMGIYRDVRLWQGEGALQILPHTVRVTVESLETDYAVVRMEGQIQNRSRTHQTAALTFSLTDSEGKVAVEDTVTYAAAADEKGTFCLRMTLDNPQLWSPESPSLYQWKVVLRQGDKLLDEDRGQVGLRTLQLDARKGLRINGQTVKLRGACIHHDNGVIGAAGYLDAERFKVRKLKQAGFNAIRSAHHPASPALLQACDEIGMLVMDELTDMWDEPKNPQDFSFDFHRLWREEVRAMVEKDFNHPSVVLYSTGNEIPEIGRIAGAALHRQISQALRELDPTRYVTCGINGILAISDLIQKTAMQQKNPQPEGEVGGGSEGLNQLMGATEQERTDALSVCQPMTDRLNAAVSNLDVAGYNYLTARHQLEHTLHPDRVVVGSETFPPEIPRLWKIVEENPHVIGDFTWTGWDYLGEAGIGIYHYDVEKHGYTQGQYPDRLAYCGDSTLNAYRRPVSYLREIAYGLRKKPFLAVCRMDRQGHPYDHNNWKYEDAVDSWTFPGFEGKEARVLVLSAGDEAELFLNGRSLGRKALGEELPLTAVFQVPYEPGELKVVSYKDGVVQGEDTLHTAGPVSALRVEASRSQLAAGEQELCFLTVDLVDDAGVMNLWEKKPVTVRVEGAGSLLGFGSGNPSCLGSYQDTCWETYDGRVLAVVRAGQQSGMLTVTFSAPGCPDAVVQLEVISD